MAKPLARIKVDEKNNFGSLEWDAIQSAALELHPKHAAVAAWKHTSASYVEQEGVAPLPKDRGAEQGDVDGPTECALTLGQVAGDARLLVHQQQRLARLPWACESQAEVEAAVADFDAHTLAAQNFQSQDARAPLRSLDPRHEVQKGGGLADFWYLDDGDILCCPGLVVPFLQAFDVVNPSVGAARSCPKTEVIYYCSAQDLEANSMHWRLDEVRTLGSVSTAEGGSMTLGVATGPDAFVAEQLGQKAQVAQAMHERIQLCSAPQSEFVLARRNLGVCRVNHILRVHGHRLAAQRDGAEAFNKLGKDALDRIFPGLTDLGHIQASLSVRQSGLGWRIASEVSRPANLGALVASKPMVMAMVSDAAKAGLCSEELLLARYEQMCADATAAYLASLSEVEKVCAEEFLRRAYTAAEATWDRIVNGGAGAAPAIPRILAAGAVPSMSDDPQEDGGEAISRGRRGRTTSIHLQKELSALRDRSRLRDLEAELEAQGNWPQLDRVRELRHADVSHKWLGHLDTRSGSVLAAADFVLNVQKRLGAISHAGTLLCRLCGTQLDPQVEHSECCSIAEATKGHYACVRALLNWHKAG